MPNKLTTLDIPGPFRADQLKSGDPYELSNGHPIECLPTGERGSKANLMGGAVLDSDPDVESAGIDTGFAPTPGTLRAPDVAVGNIGDSPGWGIGKVPPLAVEYADTGQDEDALQTKIRDLLEAGTRLVWVAHLVGPRRVEVYRPGTQPVVVYPGQDLTAPGILRNPVPVAALFDRAAAHRVTFANLLQRQGYKDLDEVRNEGRAEGKAEGELAALRGALTLIMQTRGVPLGVDHQALVEGCREAGQLRQWLGRAANAACAADVFASE